MSNGKAGWAGSHRNPYDKKGLNMDIYGISNRSGLSLRSLRKLEQLAVLKTTPPDNPVIEPMRYNIRKGHSLTALQLAALVEDPDLLWELGDHSEKTQARIDGLGDCQGSKAPMPIVLAVEGAAKDKAEAIELLCDWLRSIIPPVGPVTHYFVAVRLLLGVVPNLRKYVASRIPQALLNCRNAESFAGWSSKEPDNRGRNVTRYHRPADDYDL